MKLASILDLLLISGRESRRSLKLAREADLWLTPVAADRRAQQAATTDVASTQHVCEKTHHEQRQESEGRGGLKVPPLTHDLEHMDTRRTAEKKSSHTDAHTRFYI